MSASPQKDSVKAVQEYINAEVHRAQKQLSPDQRQAILVGVSDQGEIAVYPCRLVLPFHYPATIDELDEYGLEHFRFPESSWHLLRQPIHEFVEQYNVFFEIEDNAESIRAEDAHRRRRIAVLQDACTGFYPTLTIFGIESDSEIWWEVNTFHISGPRIPSPPLPVSDAQLLARLCRHTQSYVGKSRFCIEGGAITEVRLDGASTTDATIDLLRIAPNVKALLRALRKMSLQSTLVTERSLRFLKRELPHVEVAYSHYLQG